MLVRMRDTMVHRGPDGSGHWISRDHRVGLAHRRLAIIDLSDTALQPISNEDDTLFVVFNGEIYNHAEIRCELARTGRHTWKTDHSDTEVILHAFEEWGIDCLRRFRGMFAFALWDDRTHDLWLVRDRIGIKPLYYSINRGRLTFASEIKAILEDPGQRRAVDEHALFHFLSLLTSPAPSTLFEGIRKLPPATWLRVSSTGQLREQRYWDVYENPPSVSGLSDDELAEALLAELREAVRLRQVSDVPVGVFLSGGVDSSANTALFSATARGAVKTFTIGYDGSYESCPDEIVHARAVANAFGAEHFTRSLTVDEAIDFLPRMVWLQDEPIADPVCVPLFYVSQLARQHGVTVCQLGEGADELFHGYLGWQRALRVQRTADRMGRTTIRAVVATLRALGRDETWPFERLRRSAMGVPVFWGGAEAFTHSEKMRLLSPRLREQFAGTSTWDALAPLHRRFLDTSVERSTAAWMSYVDLHVRLPELLLMRVDKMSMGVSLESRVPFLDHRFVELAMAIPWEAKIRNGQPKALLRRAVRGILPRAVLDRRKQGFALPVMEWVHTHLGDQLRAHVREFAGATDHLDSQQVDRVLDRHNPHHLWYLANLAMWWKRFVQ